MQWNDIDQPKKKPDNIKMEVDSIQNPPIISTEFEINNIHRQICTQ